MERQRAIQLAIVVLLMALVFALIFAKRGCVSDISKKIGDLSCEDGIDNDADGYVDRNGGPEGEPPDEKCLALNEPQEKTNLSLRSVVLVDSAGGLLVLGDLRLSILQGAFSQRTEITLERIAAVSPDRLSFLDVYDLEPNSLEFQHPFVIRLQIHPQDTSVPENPWLFTEGRDNEKVLLHSITRLDSELPHELIGALTHFSKKGGIDQKTFENLWNSREVDRDCYTPYAQGPCPNDLPLCHGGLAGNGPCESCLVRSPTQFCCVCPSRLPNSDFPCEDSSGNPIALTGNCKRHEYPVTADSCTEFLNRVPKGEAGEKTIGVTFPFTNPTWEWNIRDIREQGNRFCITPRFISANVNPSLKTHYPRWNNASSCQVEWDRFMEKLREHEKGHADIAKREADAFKRSLEGQIWPEMCAATREKLIQNVSRKIRDDSSKLAEEFEDRLKTEWNAYDARTNHGEIQGAVLNCGACP